MYPITEKFALVIYGEAHWLKEMFQATLVVHNDSLTDTLEDTVATLSLPDGLSLAAMTEGTQTLTQVLGTIEGGDCKEAVWYIRGDAEGEQHVGGLAVEVLEGSADAVEERELGTDVEVGVGLPGDVLSTLLAPLVCDLVVVVHHVI